MNSTIRKEAATPVFSRGTASFFGIICTPSAYNDYGGDEDAQPLSQS